MASVRSVILGVNVINKFEFDSGHRPVRAKLRIEKKWNEPHGSVNS